LISEQEWNSVRNVAEKVAAEVAGRRVEWLQTGKVIKRDTRNRLIWIQGMGDVAIPIVSFEFDVRYYDKDASGKTIVRYSKAVLDVPQVGQTVLVAFEMGISRLPRCLGVILGKNWVEAEDDD
jgi:hypothetical protein